MYERQRIAGAILEVLGQPPTPIEPRERAFHDPAFGQHNKTFTVVTSCDDFCFEMRAYFGEGLAKLRALIGTVRKQFLQERKAARQRGEQQNPSVSILDVGRMHDRVEHESQGID